MVSLSRSYNTNSGGATFFSESVNVDDRENLQPILDSYGVFKPLNTIPAFSFHLLFTLALNIVAIIYAIFHPDENNRFVKVKHHEVRLNGYLELYQNLKTHGSLLIYVVSLWSIVIMFVQTIMQHFYPDNFAEKCLEGGVMSPIAYIAALITCEFLVIAGINVSYILKVRNFNKTGPPPDVQREEWIACASPDTFAQNEVGYRQLGDKVYDFLEKQADLIRHLKEHNARLGEKLMILSAQLEQARRN